MSIAKLLNRLTLTVGTISLVGAAAFFGASPAQAQFSGPYDPRNWDFTDLNAEGFVDTTGAPSSITLIGSNNYTYEPGQTSYTTEAAASGLVSFDWNYFTEDDSPFYDPFGFLLNSTFTPLTDDFGSELQAGTFSTLVQAGDSFGFAVNTVDNVLGSAYVTVSNFKAPKAVPEPASVLGLLAVGALGAGSSLKRKNKQDVEDGNLN